MNTNIQPHAQVQTIDGHTFEFQPEHLLCDACWEKAGEAKAMAHIYGSATAAQSSVDFLTDEEGNSSMKVSVAHSMTATKVTK